MDGCALHLLRSSHPLRYQDAGCYSKHSAHRIQGVLFSLSPGHDLLDTLLKCSNFDLQLTQQKLPTIISVPRRASMLRRPRHRKISLLVVTWLIFRSHFR
jgi:hypothetical protein